MGLNLQQSALEHSDPQNGVTAVAAALDDTQGNILKSHGRDNSVHLFVTFTGTPAEVTAWLRMMGQEHVTSAAAQQAAAAAYRENGTDGGVFVNLGLSAAGYDYAGLTAAKPDDEAFVAGAKQRAGLLDDPPVTDWEPGFQAELHALVIVAADDAADTEAAADVIAATLSGVGTVSARETGAAMRVDRDGNVTSDGSGTVREHFGFADGVSQPLFLVEDIQAARLTGSGSDRYDPSAPLDLVLLKDPGGGPEGYGSYFVFRKLQQDVASFHADEAKLATALAEATAGPGATPTPEQQALASAYIVGRFRDGTPVVTQAVDGVLSEPNDFTYADDAEGVRCPFHAHIRKTNPRGDLPRQLGLPPTMERARRIARRAVSFGPLTLDPPPDAAVGLLFLCAQSSIVDQFEFIQALWANATEFVRPATGLDPVIGQAAPGATGVPQQWPRSYGIANPKDATGEPLSQHVPYQFGQWVTLKGAEYFFLPSLGFLNGAGAA